MEIGSCLHVKHLNCKSDVETQCLRLYFRIFSITALVRKALSAVEGQVPSPRSSCTIVSIKACWMCSGLSKSKSSIPEEEIRSIGEKSNVLNRISPRVPLMTTQSCTVSWVLENVHVPVPITPFSCCQLAQTLSATV